MKPQLHIHVDDDAIVIPYHQSGKEFEHSKSLTSSDMRMGFVSREELHDPAKHATAIAHLARRIREMPLDQLRVVAIHDDAIQEISILLESVDLKPEDTINLAIAKKFLAAQPDAQTGAVQQAMQEYLTEIDITDHRPEHLEQQLKTYAGEQYEKIHQAIFQLKLRGVSALSRQHHHDWKAGQRQYDALGETLLPKEERQALLQEKHAAIFNYVFRDIPPHIREEKLQDYRQTTAYKKLELIKTTVEELAEKPEHLHRLYHAITEFAGNERVFVMPGITIGQRHRLTIKEVATLHQWAKNPEETAAALWADLEAKKDSAYPLPDQAARRATTKARDEFQTHYHHVPRLIQDTAAAMHINVLLASEGKTIKDIRPFTSFSNVLTTYGGMSSADAVYLETGRLKHPVITTEELVHQIDRNFEFTQQDTWKAAVKADLANMKQNPLAKTLAKEYQRSMAWGSIPKSNTCFSKPAFPGETDVEALPDIIYIASMVDARIQKNGKYKPGWFGKSYDSVDTVMQAAFPHMWNLYHGPKPGHALVAGEDGLTVQQPAGSVGKEERILSFRERCEEKVRESQIREPTQMPIRDDWAQIHGMHASHVLGRG